MARNFLRIFKGIFLTPQAVAPTSPSDGDMYYDATAGKFKFYQNGAWVDFSSTGITGPGSSTNNGIATWNGILGTALNDTKVTIDTSNEVDIPSGLFGLNIGADTGATTRTNSTAKTACISAYHYTNAEQYMALIGGVSGTSSNDLYIGGGFSTLNAASTINFFTAANQITLTGTNVGSVNAAGLWTIGASSGTQSHAVNGNLNVTKSIRTSGATGPLYGVYEGITATATNPLGDANIYLPINARLILDKDTPNNSGQMAIRAEIFRTISDDVTESSGYRCLVVGHTFTIPSGKTLTNSTSTSVSGITVNAITLTAGVGSLALTDYYGIVIGTDALNTGTNKTGIRIGAISGATNNWQLYSAGTSPSYFAGTVRVGSTGFITDSSEKLSVYSQATADTVCYGASIQAHNSFDGVVSNSLIGLRVASRRQIVTSRTDTQANIALMVANEFVVPSGQVLTGNSLYGLRINTSSIAGATSVAYNNYYRLMVMDDSINTGTNKYGIYIGAQSGATSNWQLYSTGTSPSQFNGPVYFASGAVGSPSIAWADDSGLTGIYRNAAHNISMSFNGVRRFTFTSTAVSSGLTNNVVDIGTSGTRFKNIYGYSLYAYTQLGVHEGSAAAPSINFVIGGYAATGLYLAAANAIGFTCAGATVGDVDNNGLWTFGGASFTGTHQFYGSIVVPVAVSLGAGSAAAPALTWGADLNKSGLYRSAANTIGFSANQVNVGSIDANGLWTIGASGGTQTHVVNGTLSISVASFVASFNDWTQQIATPANPAASHNRLYFKSDGNLYKLNSSGTETQVGAGAGDILNGGNTNGAAITIGTNDAFDLNFETSGTTKMTISATGTVSLPGQFRVGSIQDSAWCTLGYGGNPLTGTTQYAVSTRMMATSAATTVVGYLSDLGISASTAATALLGFYATNPNMSVTGTATYKVAFYGLTQTGGTNNATFADNQTFSGSWFIHSTNTSPSQLKGQLFTEGGVKAEGYAVGSTYDRELITLGTTDSNPTLSSTGIFGQMNWSGNTAYSAATSFPTLTTSHLRAQRSMTSGTVTDTMNRGLAASSVELRVNNTGTSYVYTGSVGFSGFRVFTSVVTGSCSVTNWHGIRVDDDSSATGTNKFGIYLDSQSGATNNWQIYSNGTSPSYFAGDLRVGLPGLAAGSSKERLSTYVVYGSSDAATAVLCGTGQWTEFAGDTPFSSGNSTTHSGMFSYIRRTLGAGSTVTDTNSSGFAGITQRLRFSAGTQYNYAGTQGYAGIRLMQVATDGGIINVSYLYKVLINDCSVATGTNKYGIYIGAQAGATNNWQLYSSGTSPSYFAGQVRAGNTTSIVGAQLEAFQNPAANSAAAALYARTNNSFDGNLTASSVAMQAETIRTLPTISRTDTQSAIAVYGRTQWVVPSGEVLTNTSPLGSISDFRAAQCVLSGGGGTLAITHYAKVVIEADPVLTGANKYGLYMGAISGGTTSNWQIYSAGTSPSRFAGPVQVYDGVGTPGSVVPGLTFISDTLQGFRYSASGTKAVDGGYDSCTFSATSTGGFVILAAATSGISGVYMNQNDSAFALTANTSDSTGRNIFLYGNSHATLADHLQIRRGTTVELEITETGAFTIGASAGTQTHTINGDLYIQEGGAELSVVSTNSNSSTGVNLLVSASATTADPYIYFAGASNTNPWTLGRDTSDSNAFKISQTATLGTNDYLKITSGGAVSLGASGGTQDHLAYGHFNIENASASYTQLRIHNTSTGDSQIRFSNSTNNYFATGIDQTDSFAYCISNSATVGTSTYLKITTAGLLTLSNIGNTSTHIWYGNILSFTSPAGTNAFLSAETLGANTAGLRFLNTGSTKWAFRNLGAASDLFELGNATITCLTITQAGLITLGTSGGTQAHVVNGSLRVTTALGVGAAISTFANVYTGASLTTNTTQIGYYALFTGTAAATAAVKGYISDILNAASVTDMVAYDGGMTAAASTTVTRGTIFDASRGFALGGGAAFTSKAIFADNHSYSGAWAINLTSTDPSLFSGVLQAGGGLSLSNTRTVTTTATVTANNCIILCNHSAAFTLTLPAATDGRVLIIKDISNAAFTNNITVTRAGSDLIDGSVSYIMNVNRMAIMLVGRSGAWDVV